MAIDEIRERCGVIKVCLIGLRFGGTLAVMAGAERSDIDSIVLWNPVSSGKNYLEALTMSHQETLPYSTIKPKHRIMERNYIEILGFPLGDPLLADLENIDLLAIRQKPAKKMLVVSSNEDADTGRLREHLISVGIPLTYKCLPSSQIWRESPNEALVPHQLLQAVVAWMSEAYA
jgi:hypothetical protein